jgi:hypothetical protein
LSSRGALRIGLGLAAAVLVAGAVAFGWLRFAPRHVPAGQPALVTLAPGATQALHQAFNAGEDEVRVLVLLSPT